jgi:hypothetical protein
MSSWLRRLYATILKLSVPGLFGVLQAIAVGIFRVVSVLPAELRDG